MGKEIVAFMLARMGGNDDPSKEDVMEILDAVGIKADGDKMDALFADLDKLNISVDEAIVAGTAKLAVVGSGGGGGTDTQEKVSVDPMDKSPDQDGDDSDSKSSTPGPGGRGLFDVDNSDSDESSSDDSE